MTKQQITALAALTLAALCLALAVGRSKHAAPLTAQVVGVATNGGAVNVTVQINNCADCIYFMLPPKLEVWAGVDWKPCREEMDCFFSDQDNFQWNIEYAKARTLRRCRVKTFRSGTHLRLVLEAQRYRDGLAARLFKLKYRLLHGMLLKPDDATPLLSPDTAAITDEFKAP
jgi:hypothetical protein